MSHWLSRLSLAKAYQQGPRLGPAPFLCNPGTSDHEGVQSLIWHGQKHLVRDPKLWYRTALDAQVYASIEPFGPFGEGDVVLG